MDSTRAYKFRIYPDSKRQSEIDTQLILSKNFYNKLLEKAKEAFGSDKTFSVKRSSFNKIVKEVISENKDFLKIYSQTRQEIRDRVIKSYQNFFRRVKERKKGKQIKVGFPRFKSRDRYYSIIYPQNNGSFSIEKDRLRVARIGTMKIELHRQTEGKIKTLTIKKEAGKYYTIFTTIKDIQTSIVKDTNPVGIDVGLNSFIAISDGTKIEKPKFMQEKKKKLARWQRVIARRKKGSKRREKAKIRLQKEWEHINNKSNDFTHKLSNKLVNSGYSSFAIEKLNIQDMVKNHRLARSITNASWNKFIQLLSYKAESAGLKVVKVDARDTSRTCSNCGNIQNMPLSERTYICNRCGIQIDRDINASINILKRAREGHSRSYAQGDMASTIQQVSQVASLNREHTLQKEWNPIAEEAHTL